MKTGKQKLKAAEKNFRNVQNRVTRAEMSLSEQFKKRQNQLKQLKKIKKFKYLNASQRAEINKNNCRTKAEIISKGGKQLKGLKVVKRTRQAKYFKK